MSAALTVEHLSKRYRIGVAEAQADTLVGAAASWLRSPLDNFRRLRRLSRFDDGDETADVIWALRDVSFEVQEGEVVGVIGRNGAGKSTLLKILSHITEPTAGRALIRGRVASLLEVGTGFHAELTGRENVYLNGTILGMSKAEVDRKFDEIVAFSGVEKFIDTPVKRYSSGMQVRLAFAVAAHLEPEILLIDEVLAVGDAGFQRKCLGKMQDVAGEGRTVLFVSHNLSSVLSLCPRSMLLESGRLAETGPSREIVQYYLDTVLSKDKIPLSERTDRRGDGVVKLVAVQVEGMDGDNGIQSNSRLKITVQYQSEKLVQRPKFLIGIYDSTNTGIFLLDSEAMSGLPEVLPSVGTVTCVTDPINLTPGRCYINIALYMAGGLSDYIQQAAFFDVTEGEVFGLRKLPPRDWVLCLLDHTWNHESD